MRPPTKSAVRATYERIAESFAATRREPWPEVVAFLDSLLRDSRVLDLGCGNGRHSIVSAARGHLVVGVDFSRRLLRTALRDLARRSEAKRIRWVEADAAVLPFRSEAFDAALCVAVLHHLPSEGDRIAALRELHRVLAPGGRAIVSVWAMDQPRFRDVVEADRSSTPEVRGDVEVPWTLPDGSVVPRYYHLFQEAELERIIIASGLEGETFFRGAGNLFALAKRHG